MDFEVLKDKFKEYVNKFDTSDIGIKRKYEHSLRVMDIANFISKKEECTAKEQEVANVVGLLHDYGRFSQWSSYKTYNDLESIDHGDLAVELLFDNNEIDNFYTNRDNYVKIYTAIKYHNKYLYPNDLDESNKLLCKIIRDADKLDIFYLYSIEKQLVEEDDSEIEEEIKCDFYDNIQLDRRKIKNKNDNILLCLAMVFDLNFKCSFKYLKDNQLIEKIYDEIENKQMFKEYFDYVIKYIDDKLK